MRGAHAGLLDGLLAAGVAAWMFARCQSSTPPPCCPACVPLRASYPCSEDSATRKARQAAARLTDFGEEEVQQRQQGASGPAAAEQAPLLPSAAAAFTTVGGPPAFLDPEVTICCCSGGCGVCCPVLDCPVLELLPLPRPVSARQWHGVCISHHAAQRLPTSCCCRPRGPWRWCLTRR